MPVLSDKWIKKMALNGMISPFEEKQISEGKISYGLSSFGYDARVSNEFKIFTNVNSEIVDPKSFKPSNFVTKNVSECVITPNSFVLVNVTPLEPGWEGHVTLEFSNTTPLPAKIYANEGVAQFIFLQGNEKPEISYSDRKGKYMGQTGVTLPKV